MMRTDHQLKLAQADSRIEEAERNIRHVEALLPQLNAQGVSTIEIESHLDLMSEALQHLKKQRYLIVRSWH
jgi:transposase-like protein